VVVGPRFGISAHPSNAFENFSMKLEQVAMEDRFMVRYPIPEATDCVKAMVYNRTASSPAYGKASEQGLSPNVTVISWAEKAYPKRILKFSYNRIVGRPVGLFL